MGLILFLILFYNSRINSQNIPFYNSQWANLNCPLGTVYSIYYDSPKDMIYTGGVGGIYKLNPFTFQWMKVGTTTKDSIWTNAKITAMCIDNNGIFYAGCDENTHSWISFNRGITWQRIMDPVFMKRDSINHVAINSIFAHPNGTVYFGTDSGLFLTSDGGRTYSKLDGPWNSNVLCIGYDFAGDLFVGSGGLFRSKDNSKTWTMMDLTFPGLPVNSIVVDSKGTVWACSQSELLKSSDNGETWYSLKDPLNQSTGKFDVTVDKNDFVYVIMWSTIFFTTDHGITWGQFRPDIFIHNNPIYPRSIIVDARGFIYTRQGVARVIPAVDGIFKVVHDLTDIRSDNTLTVHQGIVICQNYPNPFNPSTTITFSVPEAGRVQIKVFDVLGRQVAALLDGEVSAGKHSVTWNADNKVSGVYFYSIAFKGQILYKKMLLLK